MFLPQDFRHSTFCQFLPTSFASKFSDLFTFINFMFPTFTQFVDFHQFFLTITGTYGWSKSLILIVFRKSEPLVAPKIGAMHRNLMDTDILENTIFSDLVSVRTFTDEFIWKHFDFDQLWGSSRVWSRKYGTHSKHYDFTSNYQPFKVLEKRHFIKYAPIFYQFQSCTDFHFVLLKALQKLVFYSLPVVGLCMTGNNLKYFYTILLPL